MTLRHLFYLHGFASSARSSKGRFLAERLSARGVVLHCPDFNEPDFSTLTVSRMLRQVDELIRALAPGPVGLIGSSLEAFVALHAAAQSRASADSSAVSHPIDRLILLAPALDFSLKHDRTIGQAKLAEWRRTNRLEIYHSDRGCVSSCRIVSRPLVAFGLSGMLALDLL